LGVHGYVTEFVLDQGEAVGRVSGAELREEVED